MSGWDATSRPTWDPQGGTGENTQSHGAPDFAEEGGFPSSASPGTPPAIFLQDYDQNDFAQGGFDQGGFDQGGFDHSQQGRGDFAPTDFGQGDFGQGDFGQNGFGQADRGVRQYRDEADPGRSGYGQRASDPWDYPQQDFPPRDSREDFQRQSAGRDYAARDITDAGYADRRRDDSDSAARMDPALRDFFAPQPTRSDPLQQGYGQPRQGTRGYPGPGAPQGQGQGQGQGRGGQFGPGLSNGHRQQGGAAQGTRPGRWDDGPQRPGPRTARRQDSHAERRGLAPAAVAIGIVVVLGIAIGAYMLMRGKPAPTASSGSTPGATPTASAPTSTSTTQVGGGAAAAAYTLKTPATAGGYAKLSSIPSGVQTAAGATSQAIKSAVTATKGKVSSQVTAAYQLSGGQVLAFTGFKGTFNPNKVMASLAALGTDSHPAAAGPHGGMLACATTPAPSGTVCVWVTTTTLGITEFFSSTGPEVVTVQSKAAADTLKLRAGVEVAKSAKS